MTHYVFTTYDDGYEVEIEFDFKPGKPGVKYASGLPGETHQPPEVNFIRARFTKDKIDIGDDLLDSWAHRELMDNLYNTALHVGYSDLFADQYGVM